MLQPACPCARRRRPAPGAATGRTGGILAPVAAPALTALGLLLAVVMAGSRRAGVFAAVHGVERASHGEVLYPLGLGATALLFPGAPFVYAVLVLGLADGLAAPVGQRYGRRRIPGGKSWWGSATFFAIATAAGAAVLAGTGADAVAVAAVAVAAAAALTAFEAALRRGLDNAVLPVVAGALMGVAT